MPDSYIDYLEVREYTDHLISTAKPLIGLSSIVDITKLCAHVGEKANAVDVELEKQGVKRGDVRGDRKDVEEKAEAVRGVIAKFYHYLNSLDNDVAFDMQAFFPGGNQGTLKDLKPADLSQRAGAIVRGFDATGNANLPDAVARKTKLTGARDALSTALGGKGGNVVASIQSTAELMAARTAWLGAYNGAKRILMGLLWLHGRKDEYRLYFKDLQVNEGGGGGAPEEDPPPQDDTALKAPA